MNRIQPTNSPRKKHSIMWWLGGFFFVLLFLFLYQLFGPNSPIIVSRKTTYITKPLRPDGLPDYEQYVLDLYREGVTPENNAAAILWPALWPGELNSSQYADVAMELGLDRIPSEENALERLYDQKPRVTAWLAKQTVSYEADATDTVAQQDEEVFGDQAQLEEFSERIIDQAMSRPWNSQQIPPLAKWIATNQQPLDMLLEGSRRPHCYFPSPSLLDGRQDGVVSMLLPGVQGVREAGRALIARAMWHVGEDRPEEAWVNLIAVHRIARLVAQGETLVEQLVGIALDGMACNATQTMLHHASLTTAHAEQVLRDLAALPPLSSPADSIDQLERACFLDSMIQMRRGDFNELDLGTIGVGPQVAYVKYFSVDWNVVLRKGNQFYDRYAAAARRPDRAARTREISQIQSDLDRKVEESGSRLLVAATLSPAARNDIVAKIMLGLFLPPLEAAMNAQDRANTYLELTRLTAALAVYRSENGAYPEELDALVPSVLGTLPVDVYDAKPFVYKLADEGYLLYSLGENGADDNGSNERMSICEGRQLAELDNSEAEPLLLKTFAGADDIAIRVPRPSFTLPTIAPPADEP